MMERITVKLRNQTDIFEENWSKWLTYVSNIRPDFVWMTKIRLNPLTENIFPISKQDLYVSMWCTYVDSAVLLNVQIIPLSCYMLDVLLK